MTETIPDPRRYVQVAAALREQIADGSLKPGDPLPTLARIAEAHGVSKTTAQHGVSVLVAEGLVRLIPGPHGYQVQAHSVDLTAGDSTRVNLTMQLAAALDRRGIIVAIDVDRVRVWLVGQAQLVIKPSVSDNRTERNLVWRWRHIGKTWYHSRHDWEGAAEAIAGQVVEGFEAYRPSIRKGHSPLLQGQ